MRLHGVSARTPIVFETLNPAWYHVVRLDVTLPTPLDYAPDLSLLVYGG